MMIMKRRIMMMMMIINGGDGRAAGKVNRNSFSETGML